MDEISKYWPGLVLLINLLIGWLIWSVKQGVKGELATFDRRLSLAEAALQRAPDHDDIAQLKDAFAGDISDLKDAVAALSTAAAQQAQATQGLRDLVVRTEETVRTIHNHLLDRKDRVA